MAQGDAKVGSITSVANGSSLTIQPASGETWLLKEVMYTGKVELYLTDGTNDILLESDGAAGHMNGLNILINNTQYAKLKNVDTAAKLLKYSAVQWS